MAEDNLWNVKQLLWELKERIVIDALYYINIKFKAIKFGQKELGQMRNAKQPWYIIKTFLPKSNRCFLGCGAA